LAQAAAAHTMLCLHPCQSNRVNRPMTLSRSVVILGVFVVPTVILASTEEDGRVYFNAPTLNTRSLLRSEGSEVKHRARRFEMSDDLKQVVLQKHNELRATVTSPCTAADMNTLAWDDSLAIASQDYAATCAWAHDPRNRENKWGENLAYRWSSRGNCFDAQLLAGFVQGWYSEIDDTDWSVSEGTATSKIYADPEKQCKQYDRSTGKCMIGHYTQVVWAETTKVGCGVVACDKGLMGRGGVLLVCKYNPPGNYRAESGAFLVPYIVGASCAACPASCSNRMCEVGSTLTRCTDAIGVMTFNDVRYTDCAALISAAEKFGANWWCSDREARFTVCSRSCETCSVPNDFGMAACGDMSSAQTSAVADDASTTTTTVARSTQTADSIGSRNTTAEDVAATVITTAFRTAQATDIAGTQSTTAADVARSATCAEMSGASRQCWIAHAAILAAALFDWK